jgi:hypothetical protein
MVGRGAGGYHDSMTPTHRRTLAITLALLTAVYAAAYRFMPLEFQRYALWPFGALALYAGARLSVGLSAVIVLGMMAATDAVIYWKMQFWPSPLTYVTFAIWILLGRALLKRSHSTERVVAGALIGPVMFFLVTNAGSWYGQIIPEYSPRTLATLLLSYENGLEFLRNQWGQMLAPLLTVVVFKAHDVLARVWFPEEVVAVKVVAAEAAR